MWQQAETLWDLSFIRCVFFFSAITHFPSLLWFYSTHLWSKWAMLMGTQCSHTRAPHRHWPEKHQVMWPMLSQCSVSWPCHAPWLLRPSEESNDSFSDDYSFGCSLRQNASSLLWIYRCVLCNYFNVSWVIRAISLWVYGYISSRSRAVARWWV